MVISRTWAAAALFGLFLVSRASYTTVWTGAGRLDFGRDLPARAAAAVRGERLAADAVVRSTILLDEPLLRQDLWSSLFYLHAQPPLFNIFVAGLLRLPGPAPRNVQWINWGLGLSLAVLIWALLRRLGVRRGVALALTAAALLNPNAMWMESAVYPGPLVAAMLAAAALAFHAALVGGSLGWFAVFATLLAATSLTRAQFAWPWCFAAVALGAVAFARGRPPELRRRIIPVAAAPCLLLLAWQAKQFVVFGQLTGSSWLGFNLTAMTAGMRPEKAAMRARGEVSALVDVPRYSPPEIYRPYFAVPRTGIPALDEDFKSGGYINQNNLVYVPASRQYLRDTLRLLARAPHKYLANVANSVYIASGIQTDMYFLPPRQFVERWGWAALLAPFVGFPLIAGAVVWGVRRVSAPAGLGRAERLTMIFLVANVVYVLAVACLIEKSETVLYRNQVDSYLYALLGLALTERLARRHVRD